MKAAIYTGNRRFSTTDGVVIPPRDDEVRLEVAYCGVCGTDIHIYHGHMDHRVRYPQTIGHEFSGKIVQVGARVEGYHIGDPVTIRPLKIGKLTSSDKGFAHISENMQVIGVDTPGGMQHSITVPAYTLHKLPPTLPMSHGAMIEPLAVACHDVKLGEVKEGENCFIIGGGPIGLLIALVCKIKGANVIISEVNAARVAFAEELGMRVVNPRKQSVVETLKDWTNGHMMDLVFEVSASAAGAELMTQVPNKRGRIVMVGIHSEPRKVDLFQFFYSELKLIGARVYEAEDFEEAIELAAKGKIPFATLITEISDLDNVQGIFETIDNNPGGMKYLIDCQNG